MIIDRHTLALVSIIGSSLDVLGALYLAYDLLGGEHGPLRTLTRAVTYGALFGAGYGLFFGPVFGLICGVTHGITLASEFSRYSKHRPQPGFWYDVAVSATRAFGFALGTAYLYGAAFGATLGVLSTVGQVVAYQAGVRPTIDYRPAARLRLSKHQLLAALNRMAGFAAAGFIGAWVAHTSVSAWSVGLKFGVAIGVVTTASSACMPVVEWYADRLPEKRMGVLGVGLILVGFGLQSVQYWLTLLDVGIR